MKSVKNAVVSVAVGETHLSEQELKRASGGVTPSPYLVIDGIKGESQEDQHKDWIEVLSF